MSYPYDSIYVITGSSGSGKSLACKYLDELGAHIVNADELARDIVKPNSPALNALVSKFGTSIIDNKGKLIRENLHKIIVSSEEAKKIVEEITHPRIRELAKQKFEQALKEKKPLIIYDCPLYFEKDLDKEGFNKSILITAPETLLVQRICKRDKISKEDAFKRLKMQLPQNEKISKADIVISNDGTKKEFKDKILKLFELLNTKKLT